MTSTPEFNALLDFLSKNSWKFSNTDTDGKYFVEGTATKYLTICVPDAPLWQIKKSSQWSSIVEKVEHIFGVPESELDVPTDHVRTFIEEEWLKTPDGRHWYSGDRFRRKTALYGWRVDVSGDQAYGACANRICDYAEVVLAYSHNLEAHFLFHPVRNIKSEEWNANMIIAYLCCGCLPPLEIISRYPNFDYISHWVGDKFAAIFMSAFRAYHEHLQVRANHVANTISNASWIYDVPTRFQMDLLGIK